MRDGHHNIFCLGLDRALERARQRLQAAGVQHDLYAYIDDLTILAKPQDLHTIYTEYTKALAEAGLTTRAEKCEVWVKGAQNLPVDFPVPRVTQPTILRQHADDYSGLTPTPLTADQDAEEGTFHHSASPRLQQQTAKRRQAMNRLLDLHQRGLSAQTCLVMLRALTSGDMTWHMRTTGVPARVATALDDHLQETLEKLLQTDDLLPEQKERYWHPIALGGLGFQSVGATRLDAAAASWALCERHVQERQGLADREHLLQHCPGLRSVFHRLQRTINTLTQEEGAQQSPDTELPEATQRRITKHRRQVEWTEWLRRTQTAPHQRAWALSTTGKGAGAWLGPPTRPDHHLADAHLRVGVRHRLGATVKTAEGPCPFRRQDGTPCGGTADTHGRHTLCCSFGGFTVMRHNTLRDTLARALREADVPDVGIEPVVRPPNGPNDPGLRADLRCADCDGAWAFLDLTIVHPASQQSLQAGAAQAQGTAARLAENAKRRKYASVPNFHPLAFEVTGGMGESTRKWLARQMPEGPGRQEALSNLHRTLATCVVREVARTLLRAA